MKQLCLPLHWYLTKSEKEIYRKEYNIFSKDRHRKASDNLFRQTFFSNLSPQTTDGSVRFRIEENSFIF